MRQAFLHAVPRQDIVDRLIIPLNENATVRNAQIAVPGEPFYDQLVAENGSDEYAETDIELSKQILADAGIDTTTPIPVRFLTDSENPRRQSEYDLIRESVAQAGFDLVNASRPDWGEQLANTSIYDAALFGWQTTAIAVAVRRTPIRRRRVEQLLRLQQPAGERAGRRSSTRRPMRRVRKRS